MTDDHALLSLLHLNLTKAPSILYHYTSMQGLLSIVESGRIRATHVRFLNDQSEIIIMWELVVRRIRERMEAAESNDDKESLSEIIQLAQSRPVLNEFVTSFSEERDDLSQWRSYCPEGVGFSIGFSSSSLHTQWVSDPSGGDSSFVGAQLVKVQYVNHRTMSSIDSAIDAVMRLSSELQKSLGGLSRQQIIVGWLSIIAPSFKDAAFRHESEWRMILSKPHKPMPGQRFRLGRSTIVPFIEVELNKDTNRKPVVDYMIREVIVGPTPNADLSVEALRALFLSKGQPEVKIEKSAIPYRHW